MRSKRPPYNRSGSRRYGQRPQHRNKIDSSQSFQKTLDINCNLGQGFGIYQNKFEEKVLPYVTSVNIACGMHTGDPLTIIRAVDLAKENDLSVGALIGYNDKTGNGEREMYLEVDELKAMVLYQISALHGILHTRGLDIRHVRPHGFLYKQVYSDLLIAETVAKAIAEFSRWITLVGLSGHILLEACSNANIKPGQEVQIDKRYRKDGTILPTSKYGDKTKDMLTESAQKARQLIQTGTMTCEDKTKLRINVDTIHVPSDSEECIELARTVRAMVINPKPIHLDKYDKYFANASVLN